MLFAWWLNLQVVVVLWAMAHENKMNPNKLSETEFMIFSQIIWSQVGINATNFLIIFIE